MVHSFLLDFRIGSEPLEPTSKVKKEGLSPSKKYKIIIIKKEMKENMGNILNELMVQGVCFGAMAWWDVS